MAASTSSSAADDYFVKLHNEAADAMSRYGPPTSLPLSFGRNWEMAKRPNDFANGELHGGFKEKYGQLRVGTPISHVYVRCFMKKEPTKITFDAQPDGSAPPPPTVADVKKAFALALTLSSRKHVTLLWVGKELEDDSRTLQSLKVPDGTTFEAKIRKRTLPELEPLKNITYVIVSDLGDEKNPDGNNLEVKATAKTLVSEVKALCKRPETDKLNFTPNFTSSFGTPLANERTLGSYNILDGDILVMTPGEEVAAADAGAADAKGGKKGK